MKSPSAIHWFALFLATGTPLAAADWPQYRGPNNDGATSEKLLAPWPAAGPRVVWKATLGPSFGSFAVAGGRAFCFIQRAVAGQDQEVALALDSDTGKEIWAVPLGKATYDKQGGDGPRSTPTVEGGRVYLLGAYQVLTCLDAATGKKIWQHDLVSEFGGKVIKWNSAASPILEGDLIFVNGGGAGQALLAFHKADGRLVWKGGNDTPTHASPVLGTIHGVRQVIFFTQNGLVGAEAKTGRELWRFPFPYQVSTASSPIVSGDIVYCSAGYGVGAGACRITKTGDQFSATELWRQPGKLMNHWTTPVCRDGYLYGIYGFKEFGTAPLKCVEIATGKEVWSKPGFGSGGGTILMGDHLLVQGDRGPLVVVAAKPDAYQEVARTELYGGKCWTMAVVSDGRIYARNDKEGFCLDMAAKPAGQ